MAGFNMGTDWTVGPEYWDKLANKISTYSVSLEMSRMPSDVTDLVDIGLSQILVSAGGWNPPNTLILAAVTKG
jgi:hypothetical protein